MSMTFRAALNALLNLLDIYIFRALQGDRKGCWKKLIQCHLILGSLYIYLVEDIRLSVNVEKTGNNQKNAFRDVEAD